jgi:hypothetical protein
MPPKRQIKDDEDEYQNGHISTRAYIEAVMQSEIKRLEACIEGVEKAIDVAKEVQEGRLEGMNRFREQQEKERGTFVRQDVYEQKHQALDGKIDGLDQKVAVLDKKQTGTDSLVKVILLFFAGSATGIAILEFLTRS